MLFLITERVIVVKNKIIAIVITVVITAGTATGISVAVSKNNDKQTEEIVSSAVAEALATAESSTEEETAESTTESTTAESTTTKPVQKAHQQKENDITKGTTQPQVAYNDKSDNASVKNESETPKNDNRRDLNVISVETPLGTVIIDENRMNYDRFGKYYGTDLTYTSESETETVHYLCIDTENRLFYHQYNSENKIIRIYPEF